jgi:transglutaminase-like putative cysteine protease
MNNHAAIVLVIAAVFLAASCREKQETDYMKLIDSGNFSEAETIINEKLENEQLTESERRELTFEVERMERIRMDFNKTEAEVLESIREVIPDAGPEDLRRWEESKALEFMVIDGEKRYFTRAARNLFRIDKEAKKMWENTYGGIDADAPRRVNLRRHIKAVMEEAEKTAEAITYPARFKIRYTVTVNKNAVPDGKTIRCWIPFPREIEGRQTDLKLISTEPETHQLADNSYLQRTVYLEKTAVQDTPITFAVEYEFTNHGIYVDVDPENVVPVNPVGELAPYLQENPPHIVFSPELKQISEEVVGEETNPYRIAQKLYAWIDTNIPWASAREYSTIRNISNYPAINGHGDCGIKALMYITLLRMNGIPAHWQSGWEFQPPTHDSMHDWGMVYFEPYGRMPMDVDYGVRDTEDEDMKWFYLG